MTDTTYIGRCKTPGCKRAAHATGQAIRENTRWSDEKRRDVPVDRALPYRHGNDGAFAICPDHNRLFPLRQVQGRLVPDHKCDSRCTNAVGPKCDCSCGGKNHGIAHAC